MPTPHTPVRPAGPAAALTAALTAALLLGLAGPGQAARPLVSETADSLASGDCELETAVMRMRASGEPSGTGLEALVACGIGHGTQFSAAYGRVRAGGETGQGLALAGKTHVIEAQEGRIAWSVAYGLAWEKAAAGGWKHTGTRIFGVATQALGPSLTGHANLGWQRSQADGQSATTWSLGLEGDGPLRWTADLFGDDRDGPWASAGLLWPLGEKLNVNLAYARQFERPRAHQLTLGMKLDF